MTSERPKGEEPRSEPEIIPPGDAERGRFNARTEHVRVYVAKPGPLGAILMILIVGLLSAAMLTLLLGAFLFALPVIVLFVTAAIVAGMLRVYFQRAP
jgi:uncharacterized integral membrane protein